MMARFTENDNKHIPVKKSGVGMTYFCRLARKFTSLDKTLMGFLIDF